MKFFALIALALLAGCGSKTETPSAPATPVAAAKPPAGSDWTTTVSKTPDGGFVMGNPNAPIKLVEYGSLTCPHCADFSKETAEVLRAKYISTGKLSYEYRNYVRDSMDLTAALLSRCGGAGPFFPLLEQLYVDQPHWYEKMKAVPEATLNAVQALPAEAQAPKIAELTGLALFVNQRGLSADRAQACLTNKGEIDTLIKIRNRANDDYNLTGTPWFLINGAVVTDTFTWEALEPKIKAAGA